MHVTHLISSRILDGATVVSLINNVNITEYGHIKNEFASYYAPSQNSLKLH